MDVSLPRPVAFYSEPCSQSVDPVLRTNSHNHTMSRLKNYYAQLIEHRKHSIDPWLRDYKSFTADVEAVRSSLRDGLELRSPTTYAKTKFSREGQPFEAFLRQLLYEKSNGISSRGQSVLSKDDFAGFLKNENFLKSLEGLIRDPDQPEHFESFRQAWSNSGAANRPLLVNRVLAACTTNVSTTVDEGKFGSVYWWMVQQGLIPSATMEVPDWRTKNLHLIAELHSHFAEEVDAKKTDPHLLSVFVWELYSNLSNPFSLRKQVVRHGSPGTGKTFKAMQDAKLQFAIWKAEFDSDGATEAAEHIRTVQFHPSYTYEDFMEGLRPAIADGTSKLRLENGIFKKLCIEAAQWELDVATEISRDMAEKWDLITIGDLIPFRDKLKHPRWNGFFNNDGAKKATEAVPPFFLIIDEINRAELSRVLGELMFCLEYRGIKGAIQTQYSGLNGHDTGMLKVGDSYQFFIPHNIYVIGTMNTIDRSVESFDFALRRRFRWEEVGPDLWVLEYHLKETGRQNWLGLVENLEALNERITAEPLLGPDYQVGHAYLMNLSYAPQLTLTQIRDNVWEDFIKPLLEEYLRGSGKTKDLLQELAKCFGKH